jgi:hypothetical protein
MPQELLRIRCPMVQKVSVDFFFLNSLIPTTTISGVQKEYLSDESSKIELLHE